MNLLRRVASLKIAPLAEESMQDTSTVWPESASSWYGRFITVYVPDAQFAVSVQASSLVT